MGRSLTRGISPLLLASRTCKSRSGGWCECVGPLLCPVISGVSNRGSRRPRRHCQRVIQRCHVRESGLIPLSSSLVISLPWRSFRPGMHAALRRVSPHLPPLLSHLLVGILPLGLGSNTVCRLPRRRGGGREEAHGEGPVREALEPPDDVELSNPCLRARESSRRRSRRRAHMTPAERLHPAGWGLVVRSEDPTWGRGRSPLSHPRLRLRRIASRASSCSGRRSAWRRRMALSRGEARARGRHALELAATSRAHQPEEVGLEVTTSCLTDLALDVVDAVETVLPELDLKRAIRRPAGGHGCAVLRLCRQVWSM